jgi:hypothetical protein
LFAIGKIGHENISLFGNGLLFQQGAATYLSPEITLRYFKPLPIRNNYSFGIAPSVSYWTTKVLSTRNDLITPELALVFFQRLNISYGYNIPLTTNRPPFISAHRLSVRFIVF